MKQIFSNFFTWRNVNTIGKNRFSRTSYIYLLVIPIIAKLTENITTPLRVRLGIDIYDVDINMPFSWYLFFFGALLIYIGTLLYNIFCPSFIKRFSNFGDFKTEGETDFLLFELGESYIKDDELFLKLKNTEPFISDLVSSSDYLKNSNRRPAFGGPIQKGQNISYEYEYLRKAVFSKLYQRINHSFKWLIYLVMLIYATGISCFIWVLVENILFVVKTLC